MVQRIAFCPLAITACALVMLLSGRMTLPTKAAHAAVPIFTCLGHVSDTFSPTMTNRARLITIKSVSSFFYCSGIASRAVLVTSGAVSSALTSFQACNEAPGTDNVSYVQTITWNNGQISSIDWTNVSISAVNGTATVIKTGIVTFGLGAGSHAKTVVHLQNPHPLACATTGISSEEGNMTFALD